MHGKETSPQTSPATSTDARSVEDTSAERRVGRHRLPADQQPGLWARLRPLLSSTPVRATLATGLTCCLGFVAFTESWAASSRPEFAPRDELAERAVAAQDEAASRSLDRSPLPATPIVTSSPTPAATSSPTPAPHKTAKPTPTKLVKPVKPARPTPVAGLTQAQMDNAKVIVDVGLDLAVPRRGLVIAIATAMQESNLYNLASTALPESQNYPNQGLGSDHDSVGLFQQRPSSGWGTVADLMRPAYAARQFYLALLQVPGWQQLPLTVAAQAVQVSAFPDAYAQHEGRATTVVEALV